jgi:uracil phosphoribosyltransferase
MSGKAQCLVELGKIFLEKLTHLSIVGKESIFLVAPRGGSPLFEGFFRFDRNLCFFTLNTGQNRNYQKSIIDGISIDSSREIVIVDSIIDTGGTIIEIISEIKKTYFGKIIVVSAFATTEGIYAIMSKFSDTAIYVLRIEDCIEWIPTSEGEKRIVKGLDDFGEYINYI